MLKGITNPQHAGRVCCVDSLGQEKFSTIECLWRIPPYTMKYGQKMRILLSCQYCFILMLVLLYGGVPGIAFCQTHLPVTIAFASNIDGNWEIYLTNTVGKLPINLTLNPAADYYPTWSPDGTEIAFFSRRDDNHEIYVMRADGTHQRRLTHHPATDKAPSWAPDGKRLAFSSNREGHFDIFLLELESGVVENLTKNLFEDGIPTWSPDGKNLVFHSKRQLNWDIYTINVSTREEQRLTHQPLMDTYPAWSPDGKQIVYASMRQDVDQEDFDLYLMDAADGGDKKPLTDTPTDEAVPAWAPDGRLIVFQSEQDGRWVIHLMKADGSGRRKLIDNGAWAAQPKWQRSSTTLSIETLFLQYQQWGKLKTPWVPSNTHDGK